ncbi:MAG: Gfo/Idh/MocA family oxidoreductase [Pirellulaceae bacterium]|jgi:predicted dehydrogenase|nr:Gfo/Idh/MocA family oxidoreductase [Pirellulaceae bacterium]
MTRPNNSRREFLKNTGRVAAASALVTGVVPQVHAAADDTIQVALIGCGGRGTGAVANALSVPNGRTKLVAMADVFDSRLKSSYENLNRQFTKQVDVPAERKFVSFDGYKMAMDCLNPGDVVIMTTPCAFRGLHFAYAIEKGLHVFMEKPLTVDGPSSRLMFELGEKSVKKNLKVGVGLMCRHCKARQELFERIQSGEIGDITLLRAYRMAGPTGSAAVGPKPENISELMYQIRNFHGFLWASGGAVSDFLIHNIDESCWMKNDWPVQAKANGGRHYRGDNVDQNFDSYSIEYTFGDGTKLLVNGRTIPGCHQEFASYAHGTKGSAVISSRAHTPAKSRIYSGHNFNKQDLTWAFPGPEPNPYQVEWNDLIDAIRNDQPYNEVERGTKASLVTSMGRMAAHTGQLVTYDEIFNHEHEFAPNLDKLTLTAAAPVPAGDTGKYPIPLPGINANREY